MRIPLPDVHVPLLATQFVAQDGPVLRGHPVRQHECAPLDGGIHGREQLAPKDRHHHAYRQQKAMAHGVPVPRVGEPTARHQTVEMRMHHQRLTPGMERGDEARTGAQILRVAKKFVQRRVHRGKQQVGHRSHIRQSQPSQLIGLGEDDMVVIAGQQPRLLPHQPALDLEPGARRAHPMPTRMIPDAFHMPLRAGLDVATQARGATGQQRPHRLPHVGWQRVTLLKCGIAALEDLLYGDLSHALLHQWRIPSPVPADSSNAQAHRRCPAAGAAPG